LEEIAGVEGVDAVFIGPSDLAASLGHLGNPGHPTVQEHINNALSRLKRLGVPAGTLATTTDDAARYLGLGFDFVAVGLDLGLLLSGAKKRLEEARTFQVDQSA
jgi:4-hydroxy-2-oxoheptanedioate aldolase